MIDVKNGGSGTINATDKEITFTKSANQKNSFLLRGESGNISSLSINAKTIKFNSSTSNKSEDGVGYTAAWQEGYSKLELNADKILVGSEEKGGDRAFRFKKETDYNTLEIHANKIVAYVLDGFINAQGSQGHSVAQIGTSEKRIGHFEAHTTYGKDDYGVAILQANEGNTVSLYAVDALLDGSTGPEGGVLGSGGWGTVNVDVSNTLTIRGNLCGTYGELNQDQDSKTVFEMNVKAEKLDMEGDVNAGSMGTPHSTHKRTAVLNIDAGEGSLIKGNFNVYEHGNTAVTGNLAIDGDINVQGGGNVLLGGRYDATVDDSVKVSATYGGNITINGAHTITLKNGTVTVGGTLNALNTTVQSEAATTFSSAQQTQLLKLADNAVANLKSVDNVSSVELNKNSILKLTDTSSMGSLTTDNATLYLSGNAQATVGELSGTATVSFDNASNKAVVSSVAAGSSVTSLGTSTFNERYASAEAAAQAALGVVVDGNGKTVADKVVINESESNGAFSADIKDNAIDLSSATKTINHKTEQIGKTVAQNVLAWRLEMNDMNKRLGELRDSEGNTGVWVRVNAGKQKYEGAKNNFTQFQFGADTKVEALANIHTGLAFSYTDSDLSYTGGSGDNKIYGLAAYGSWLGDKGSFVDVIAKVARLESDSVIDGTSADFNTTAYSISAEMGHRFDFANTLFLEPQAELSWGYVDGKSFSTINRTSQIATRTTLDSTTSLIGRLGFRAGIALPEKAGTAYVRTSVLREFDGDVSVTRGDGTHTQDGSDTWFEYAIGGSYNVKGTQLYADLSRTSNADVSEPWRFNVGARWSF